MLNAPQQLLASRIKEPLILIDAGARWGTVHFWHDLGDRARIYCFEADAEEAARLNAENANGSVEYVPSALAGDASGRTLIITEGIGCSSTYKPIKQFYERYTVGGLFRPARELAVPSIALDDFCADRNIGKVHAMKLDTQGAELEILKSARGALEHCLFLNVETEFNPLYEGQGLFCDIDRFLRDEGFVLWRFSNLAHYSTGIVTEHYNDITIAAEPGSYEQVLIENGQVFWADSFYVKEYATPLSLSKPSMEEAVAGALIVSQWNLWDLALEFIRKSGDERLLSDISKYIKPGAPIRRSARRIEQLEKREAELLAENAALRERHKKDRRKFKFW